MINEEQLLSPLGGQSDISSLEAESLSSTTPRITEYKSQFTPFDQYVYNQVTDSFVQLKPQDLHLSRSNQNLADSSGFNEPTTTTFEQPLFSPSPENGNKQVEPWYKEVLKRNEKANEYRFKSELGHRSQTNSPNELANIELTGSTHSDSQHSDQQQQHPFRFTPSDYKQRDHLIAHMANNNNFKLPKEQLDQPRLTTRGRTYLASPSSASAANHARSRSQSTRRQPAPVKQVSPVTKSNQTTPTRAKTTSIVDKTKTIPEVKRASTARTAALARPKSQVSQKVPAQSSTREVRSTRPATTTATASRRPTTTATRSSLSNGHSAHLATRPPQVAVNRNNKTTPTGVTNTRPSTASSSRLTTMSTKTTTSRTANPVTSAPTARTPISRRTTPISSSSASSAKSRAASKPTPSANTTVKSIKTPKAMAAAAAAAAAVTVASSSLTEDTSKVPSRDEAEAEAEVKKVIQEDENNLTQAGFSDNLVENYANNDLIFTTTEAGNMLADEIAQAERASSEAAKSEPVLLQQVCEETDCPISKSQTEQTAVEEKVDVEDDEKTEEPSELINGLAGGLISAEDQFELSERESSINEVKDGDTNGKADSSFEQSDQNPDDEPYSIIPTTAANDDKFLAEDNDVAGGNFSQKHIGEVLSSSSSSSSELLEQSNNLIEEPTLVEPEVSVLEKQMDDPFHDDEKFPIDSEVDDSQEEKREDKEKSASDSSSSSSNEEDKKVEPPLNDDDDDADKIEQIDECVGDDDVKKFENIETNLDKFNLGLIDQESSSQPQELIAGGNIWDIQAGERIEEVKKQEPEGKVVDDDWMTFREEIHSSDGATTIGSNIMDDLNVIDSPALTEVTASTLDKQEDEKKNEIVDREELEGEEEEKKNDDLTSNESKDLIDSSPALTSNNTFLLETEQEVSVISEVPSGTVSSDNRNLETIQQVLQTNDDNTETSQQLEQDDPLVCGVETELELNSSDEKGRNELLMNVTDLMGAEMRIKQEMARKADLARKNSSPQSTFVQDEVLLSANELNEQLVRLTDEDGDQVVNKDDIVEPKDEKSMEESQQIVDIEPDIKSGHQDRSSSSSSSETSLSDPSDKQDDLFDLTASRLMSENNHNEANLLDDCFKPNLQVASDFAQLDINDEFEDREKLSNRLTNSEDELILEPRNYNNNSTEDTNMTKLASSTRFNETGNLLDVLAKENRVDGELELDDGSSATLETSTAAENLVEKANSKLIEISSSSSSSTKQTIIKFNLNSFNDDSDDDLAFSRE